MKRFILIRNKLDEIYVKHPTLTDCLIRFVLALACLLIMRGSIGFNTILSNIFVVLICSVVCAFIPLRLELILIIVYAALQTFSLSVGIGMMVSILMAVMYLVYFRFDARFGYILLLMPMLFMVKLPVLLPLILAASFTGSSIVAVAFGSVTYYIIHYLHANAAIYSGLSDTSETMKMSMAMTGIFTNKEMLYTTICILIMFFAVYYLKKVNVNQSNTMAISAGSGIYIITIIISNLGFGTMTSNKLLWIVVGTVISALLAMLISAVILPLDYLRTELIEFEDEEYHYYVRAVPKASIEKESVRIKQINSRIEIDQTKGKEESL